jgi:hypothetical protein
MRTPWLVGLVGIALCCLAAANVVARTWYIKTDGSGDAPTILAGMDSAVAGDTVLIACGTYNEHRIVMKSGVCLRGEVTSPPCVTIDAQLDPLMIAWIVDASAVVEGLILVHGSSSAINCSPGGDGPTFRNCVIADSWTPTVVVTYGRPTFENCVFYGNHGTSPTILAGYFARPRFTNCTFAHNNAGISINADASAILENCIIAHCAGFSLGNDETSGGYDISCTNFFANASARDDSLTAHYTPSCFVGDPQFCGVPDSDNYYLQSDSPCAPGNHPNAIDCGLIGALPVLCGVVKVEARTWGSIKAVYSSDN